MIDWNWNFPARLHISYMLLKTKVLARACVCMCVNLYDINFQFWSTRHAFRHLIGILCVFSHAQIKKIGNPMDLLCIVLHVCPTEEFFTCVETSSLLAKGCKIRSMLVVKDLCAGRNLYRATPAATRNLGVSGVIQRTTPFSRLLRCTKGHEGSILTWILMVLWNPKCYVYRYDHFWLFRLLYSFQFLQISIFFGLSTTEET
jgi:hypothetical protein